jgi:NADPH-dependent 7-cyano-7-deazaguanine reductase QueF-like protein
MREEKSLKNEWQPHNDDAEILLKKSIKLYYPTLNQINLKMMNRMRERSNRDY